MYAKYHHLMQKLYFHPENLVDVFKVPAISVIQTMMLLDHQNQIFCFVSWHEESVSTERYDL